jgi:hypothetical protein
MNEHGGCIRLIFFMMLDGLGAGAVVGLRSGLDATGKTIGATELNELVLGGGYVGAFELGGCMGLTLFIMRDGLGAGAVVVRLDATGMTSGIAEFDGLVRDSNIRTRAPALRPLLLHHARAPGAVLTACPRTHLRRPDPSTCELCRARNGRLGDVLLGHAEHCQGATESFHPLSLRVWL